MWIATLTTYWRNVRWQLQLLNRSVPHRIYPSYVDISHTDDDARFCADWYRHGHLSSARYSITRPPLALSIQVTEPRTMRLSPYICTWNHSGHLSSPHLTFQLFADFTCDSIFAQVRLHLEGQNETSPPFNPPFVFSFPFPAESCFDA